MSGSKAKKRVCRLVCISGSSGVGKSTVANLIACAVGKATVISGDDFHRWERGDPMWKKMTHLNPAANDLIRARARIMALVEGKSISHRRYSHESGKFRESEYITPENIVIYEGLHALMDSREPCCPQSEWDSIPKINIFVTTTEDLKVDWKIARDTRSRGYTREQVLKAMEARVEDEAKFIAPQESNADIVVTFDRNADGDVGMSLRKGSTRGRCADLSLNGIDIGWILKEMETAFREFVSLSRRLGSNPELVQGAGGNMSVKVFGKMDHGEWVGPSKNTKMIIKRSGTRVEEASMAEGWVVLDCDPKSASKDERMYDGHGPTLVRGGIGHPSMEYGMHMALPHRVVAHTHPIHLNAILCSKEAKSFFNYNLMPMGRFMHHFVPYKTPGLSLSRTIRSLVRRKSVHWKKETIVLLLQNHGLVVAADTERDAREITDDIEEWAKEALRCASHKRTDWVRSDMYTVGCRPSGSVTIPPLFPDAAVFPAQMSATNEYILRLLTNAGLTPNFMSAVDTILVKSLDSEQRRRAMA